jgi:hypothetical protein
MRIIFAIGILALGASCASVSAPVMYSAGPTYGTVVDAETKQPIAGAVVVAQWVLEGGMHWDRVGLLKIGEAVTDESGAFRIDAWGPLSRPPGGVLDGLDPTIVIFKPAYRAWGGHNPDYLKPGAMDKRDSVWNGKEIPLKREGSVAERRDSLIHVRVTLSGALRGECKWKDIPNAIRALEKEVAYLEAAGLFPARISAKRLMENPSCGPYDDFKRVYDAIQ